MMSSAERSQAAPAPAATPGEAAALTAHFVEVMDELLVVVEEETKLVRAGRSRDAAALEPRKADLARLYLVDAARMRGWRDYFRQHAPELLKDLQERHDVFRALLQINLTVLATAHAVAEGLVRGVSGELARKVSPSTYTAYGRGAAAPSSTPPMAISRQL